MREYVFFFPVAVYASCLLDDTIPAHSLGADAVRAMSRAADAKLTWEESIFVAVPSNSSARASLEHITSKPHVAGTAGDYEMAKYVQGAFRDAGITDAVIDPQRVLLTYPVSSALELVDQHGHVLSKASLAEEVLASDKTSDTWWRNHSFNGYSPSGEATAPLVYANFGLPEDFEVLKAAGIQVRGAIAIMRYGQCFRGLKAMNAQKAGAVAAIIYSDPEQDGYAQGSVYPGGPWRPESSVQRGSTQFISRCAGDPSRAYAPHGKTVEEVCGLSQDELIPQIPVLPLSYGDALPFLESLGGAEAPSSWQGALKMTYRMGPTKNASARLRVNNRFQTSPVWNVIAKIPGSLPADRDQPVILGNHRDAWVFGAADPNSGTAQLLEVARGLGALLRRGWRPLRTIVLCSWSGEEYGLLGSTAWGEVEGDSESGGLLSRAVAYLNVDTGVSGKNFRASGTPSLGRVLAGVLGQVTDPQTSRPLSELWAGELLALGSGSDYTIFIDHLGIATLDMAFSPKAAQYGVYHSVYDSFTWMATEGDPDFSYHVAMAQVWGLVALRLAGAAAQSVMPLPFNFTLQAEAIAEYIVDEKAVLNATAPGQALDFRPLERAAGAFRTAAATAAAEAQRLAVGAAESQREIAALNERFALLERRFLLPREEGLPGRKWFRHCLQAPGLYTGYAPKTLPGIYEAIRTQSWQLAQAQIAAAAERIAEAASFLSAGNLQNLDGEIVV